MPDKGWHRTFDDPIPLPDGGDLRTLRDSGDYIRRLVEARARCAGMARGDSGVDAGRRAWRRHDAAEDRDHAGAISGRDGADAA
jgi:hypothetical protein